MSRLVRRSAIVGAAAGVAYAAWRFLASRSPDTAGVTYEPQPFPMPPRPVPPSVSPRPKLVVPSAPAAAESDALASDAHVEPDGDGNCPISHPIKGKRTSGIYHLPGGFAYERTRADRCYRDAADAESDGLRAAKR